MKTCKYCGKWIEWRRDASGKAIPVDPDGTPHHRTCRAWHAHKAEQARRDREAKLVYGLVRAACTPPGENPDQLHFPF